MSTENRAELHARLVAHIRTFIAGTILFNQKVADRMGVHLRDMQCINLIELLEPVTPGKLAECTGLSTGGVTVLLDRLEKHGFIKREPNPQDRRSVLVRVNPKKLEKVHGMYAAINRQLAEFTGTIPEAELRLVVKFFEGMNSIRRNGTGQEG